MQVLRENQNLWKQPMADKLNFRATMERLPLFDKSLKTRNNSIK